MTRSLHGIKLQTLQKLNFNVLLKYFINVHNVVMQPDAAQILQLTDIRQTRDSSLLVTLIFSSLNIALKLGEVHSWLGPGQDWEVEQLEWKWNLWWSFSLRSHPVLLHVRHLQLLQSRLQLYGVRTGPLPLEPALQIHRHIRALEITVNMFDNFWGLIKSKPEFSFNCVCVCLEESALSPAGP